MRSFQNPSGDPQMRLLNVLFDAQTSTYSKQAEIVQYTTPTMLKKEKR